MKFIYSYCLIIFFLSSACGGTAPNKSNTLSDFVRDDEKINYIDSICLATNKAMFHKPKLQSVDVSQFEQSNLQIGYYTNLENGLTRILISENEYRILHIKYIFFKEDKPILFHHRYWDKNPMPQIAEETYIYFDEEGKMFYAGERKTELYEGEIPAKLKSIDLTTPDKSKKELNNFFEKYWKMSKPLVDQQMANESAANSVN